MMCSKIERKQKNTGRLKGRGKTLSKDRINITKARAAEAQTRPTPQIKI